MAVPSDNPDAAGLGQHTANALRIAFVLTAVVALILGYLGLDEYLARDPAQSHDVFTVLYSDLQLFVLGSDPLQNAKDLPVTLQIARFAAPAVTLFALTEAIRLLLATELGRLRARRSRGHAIVCGDSSAARTLARHLQLAQRRVVVVRSRPIGSLELRHRNMLGVNGDATDPDVLRGAGAARATVIYACTDDSVTNVAIATAAGRVLGDSAGSATVYAQIHDPDRAAALQARRLGVDAAPGLRLDFFNLDQLAVQVLLTQRPLSPVGDRAPHLLVAGSAPFARALLVAIARDWRLRRSAQRVPARIDLVAPQASAMLASLTSRYVVLTESCRVTAYNTDVPRMLADHPNARYDNAYLCYDDEEYGLQIAMTAYELWHRVSGSVLVPVDRLAGLTDAFGDGGYGQPLLDQVHGRIKLFPKISIACDPGLIAEDLVERLARLIHERYVIACRDRPDEPTDPAALVDWVVLDDVRRRSNRAQATSIGAKLHAIGCTIVARGGDDDFTLDPAEVERLAAAEQQRWLLEARAAGWRYGPVRDRAAKVSPYLLDWADLPDERREKNRAAIRDLPAILADAGFQVVRVSDTRGDRASHLV